MGQLKNKQLNVMCTESEWAMVRAMAERRGVSMGFMVRSWINTAHAEEESGTPHCMGGTRCYMPHLHPSAMLKGGAG